MRVVDVLRAVPGLSRDRLYFWEARGYVVSERVRRGERTVRDYSPEQCQFIKGMFKLYSAGLSPRAAHEKTRAGTSGRAVIPEEIFSWNGERPADIFGKQEEQTVPAGLASLGVLNAPPLGANKQVEQIAANLSVVYRPQSLLKLAQRVRQSIPADLADVVLCSDPLSAVVAGAAAVSEPMEFGVPFPPILVWEGVSRLAAHRWLLRGARVLLLAGILSQARDLVEICGHVNVNGGTLIRVVALLNALRESDRQLLDRHNIRVESVFQEAEVFET